MINSAFAKQVFIAVVASVLATLIVQKIQQKKSVAA
jgi:hypothetical protein